MANGLQLARGSMRNRNLLKISIENGTSLAVLKVEGRLVGPWATELDQTWNAFKHTLGTRTLRLDICGVTFVDERGKRILREIFRETGAEILSNTPLSNHFAEQTRQKTSEKIEMRRNIYSSHHAESALDCQCCRMTGEGYFCHLTPQAIEEFAAIKDSHVYPTGAILFLEKQSLHGIYLLCTGKVKLFIGSSGGKTLTLRIARPGEIIGLMAEMSGTPYEVSAETLEPCKVAFVRHHDFANFVTKYPEVYQAMLRQLSAQYNGACEQLRTVGLSVSADEKLARLLLRWSFEGRKTKEGTQITVPLTHEQIAECIGSTRETITRTLSEFKNKHLVTFKGATMTISDLPALEKIGGDC